jgi:hypothetical protein
MAGGPPNGGGMQAPGGAAPGGGTNGGTFGGRPAAPGGGANGGTFGGGQATPGGTASGGTSPGGGTFGGGPGGGGAGPFGGNSAALTEALAYAEAHGGGTIGVSSQSGAAAAIIDSDADVAGLGGFSGRESEVSVAWLEQAVADGRIRYVLVDGNQGFGPQDGRTGASTVMDWVQQNGTELSDGLYDLSGTAPGSS